MKACFNFSKKMVLWNRSSSAMEAGGITGRTGSSTENQFSNQSTSAQSTNSSGGGWFSKAKDFFTNTATEGAGKVIGGLATAYGAYKGYKEGGIEGMKAGMEAAKIGKETVASMFDDDSKFAKGLRSSKVSENISKAANATAIYKDDKLDKAAKLKAFSNLMNGSVADTSNGHVPVGYSAASSQGAVVSTGSNGLRNTIKKFNKKAKGTKNTKKTNKTKQTKTQWKEWSNKNRNKKKK